MRPSLRWVMCLRVLIAKSSSILTRSSMSIIGLSARRAGRATLCGGGCLWEARTTTGDPMYPNPVACEQTRYRYELAMEMCMEIAEADASLLQRRYDLEVAS